MDWPHGNYCIPLHHPSNPSAGTLERLPETEMKEATEALTDLCQKQVNHWNLKNPMTPEQIQSIKKIAKISILTRSQRPLTFVVALQQGSSRHRQSN